MPRKLDIGLGRRALLFGGIAASALAGRSALAIDRLKIGGEHGTIDFSIGNTRIFSTTGSFKDWRGMVDVDEADIPRSRVDVRINTKSVEMLDSQQTAMLKDADFFDVEDFPEMTFHSKSVQRTGGNKLKVTGEVTLRGITKPMVLDISVTDRKPDAPAGARYARFRGEGKIKRSEFGMTKYIDVVGDVVDISIRAEAWR